MLKSTNARTNSQEANQPRPYTTSCMNTRTNKCTHPCIYFLHINHTHVQTHAAKEIFTVAWALANLSREVSPDNASGALSCMETTKLPIAPVKAHLRNPDSHIVFRNDDLSNATHTGVTMINFKHRRLPES